MSGSLTNGLSTNTGTVVGSGSDTITLLMSGDAFGPAGAPGADAEFTLNVDGRQIGGLQDVSASKSAGEEQTFTFLGNFAPGSHDVTITFANNDGTQGDQTDFGRGGDRNLYVDGVAYNGQVVSDGTTPIYESPLFPPNGPLTLGNAVFTVDDTTSASGDASDSGSTTPGPVDVGAGSDTLTLSMAEDPFQGDAMFTVSVDGQQVGGVQTTSAVAWQGQAQDFNLHGDWGSGAHTVDVTFLNDAAGAFNDGLALDNQDRNLYIKGVSYDGIAAGGTPWELASNGSQSFSIGAGGQPGTFVNAGSGVTDGSSGATDTANGSIGGDGSSTSGSDTISGGGTVATDGGGDGSIVSGGAISAGTQSGSGDSGMSFMPPSDNSGSDASGSGTGAGTDAGMGAGTTGSNDGSQTSMIDPNQDTGLPPDVWSGWTDAQNAMQAMNPTSGGWWSDQANTNAMPAWHNWQG
jgi:hypothetical protein